MTNEVINPYQQFLDDEGLPLAAGTATFFVNTTATLDSIFSDDALTVSQSNPYTLDAAGRIRGDVRYSGKKTLQLKNAGGETIRTLDDVASVNSNTASEVSYTSTTTVKQKLDNLDVADYTELIAITPAQFEDGDTITITNPGIKGPGNIRKVVGHGFTTTFGVIVFIDVNTYWERQVDGHTMVEWFVTPGSADMSAEINACFLHCQVNAKAIDFGDPIYDITATVGNITGGVGQVQDIYSSGATLRYTGTGASIALKFFNDAPHIHGTLKILRETVGVDLYTDLTGAYAGSTGISAPKIRSKMWDRIFVEGFNFAVDQNIDQNIDSGYRSSRNNFTMLDFSGCLVGWNAACNNDGFLTNYLFTSFRYAGTSVQNGGVNTGIAFRGNNDGGATSDAYPRALVFQSAVFENCLYAIRNNANGKGNVVQACYFEGNTNNVFLDDNPGNPLASWSVFGDQDESANVLTNPDFVNQKHTVIVADRDVHITSNSFTIINDIVGMAKTAQSKTTMGLAFDTTTGLLEVIGSAGAVDFGTTGGSGSVAAYFEGATQFMEIRALGGANGRINGSGDLEIRAANNLLMPTLPTSDPGGSGRLWNDSGTLKIT